MKSDTGQGCPTHMRLDGMWARGDLNPHGLRHKILSLACLPFHHSPEKPHRPLPSRRGQTAFK